MYKFVGSNSDGLPLKRKQSQWACDTCRKRKKRCVHWKSTETGDVSNASGGSTSANTTVYESPMPTTVPRAIAPDRPAVIEEETSPAFVEFSGSDYRNRLTSVTSGNSIRPAPRHDQDAGDDPHFIGDLNPEGIFLADASPTTTMCSAEDPAGIWLERKAVDGVTSRVLRLPLNQRHSSSLYSSNHMTARVFLPYEAECLRVLPPQEDFEALQRIYLEDVHPLFPALDLEKLPPAHDVSPTQIMIKQAICLAASTSPLAKNHLIIQSPSGESRLRSPNEFATQVSLALRTSIDLGLIKDKIVSIQVLALLSLFTQLAEDRHSSAELASRAVSYIHTTGLHLDTQKNRKDHDFVTRLFCCVWVLDRLNAAFHGRPVLMHERDYGRDIELCIKSQDPTFQLLLKVVLLLDKVIALYRPCADENKKSWETDFPSFEDLLGTSGPIRAGAHLLATIETLYHAVAMLTCRTHSLDEPAQSSVSYMRRSLSSSAIISIVGTEFQGRLSMLPVVPYAVSLSLRFSYRELRMNKLPFFRARSRRQLLVTSRLLRDLGERFPASMLMVELAEQTVREMDKVSSSMANARPQGSNGQQTESFHTNNSLPNRIQPGQQGSAAEEGDRAENNSNQEVSSHSVLVEQSQGTRQFDPDMFDAIPDFDIFDHFDPDFDLGAIDATLGENLAPCFPYMDSDYEY